MFLMLFSFSVKWEERGGYFCQSMFVIEMSMWHGFQNREKEEEWYATWERMRDESKEKRGKIVKDWKGCHYYAEYSSHQINVALTVKLITICCLRLIWLKDESCFLQQTQQQPSSEVHTRSMKMKITRTWCLFLTDSLSSLTPLVHLLLQ